MGSFSHFSIKHDHNIIYLSKNHKWEVKIMQEIRDCKYKRILITNKSIVVYLYTFKSQYNLKKTIFGLFIDVVTF